MALVMTRSRWLDLGVGLGAGVIALTASPLLAQQMPIGSVSVQDATVTGAASTVNDRAMLVGNGTVTATSKVAYVQLNRGGSVKVCATSGVHLTAGVPSPADPSAAAATPANAAGSPVAQPVAASAPIAPLMVALDRGALELRMATIPSDVLMTPDLKIAFSEAGQLDLRIRVTRNGDTCVENRVAGFTRHPTLRVGSLFGDESYNVMPGQHVLFERGSLREVVDNETSPCGCPDQAPPPVAIAQGEISLKPGEKVSSTQAAVLHPFPAAVSQGLAPAPEVPQAPAGVVHAQVSTTLVYSGDASGTAAGKDTAAKPPAPQKTGFFHSIGRFFKRAFQ
jgi:hypothetical protein